MTPDDLDSLSAGLATAKRVTVYLREPVPSLGLDAGASARVIAVNGSTVTVRPKGIDDELPFEATELRKTRVPASTRAAAPRRRPPATATATPPAATEPARAAAQQAPAKTAERRKRSSPAAVSVTITSAGAGTWLVSVLHGTKKQGKPTQVAADRVAQAMRDLGDDTAITAVDGVINSARDEAQRRIAELSQELEDARATLESLKGE